MGRKLSDAEEKKMVDMHMKIEREYISNPKHRNPKAYDRFKSMNTDYSAKKTCEYGSYNRKCDAGCLLWESCKNGRNRKDWKGDENARIDSKQ